MGGLVIGMSNLEMFVVIKTFPGLVKDIGQSGVFYLYSAACTFAAIFVFIFVEDNENVKRTDWQNWMNHFKNNIMNNIETVYCAFDFKRRHF